METKRFKIEDVILDISMGPFGSDIKKEVYTDSGVPVLNGSNLQGFELVEDSFGYVTEEKADSLKKANAHRGDIVITHRGTIGQIVYIPQNSKFERYVISQSQFRVTCNKDIVLPEYLTYYFHTREGQYKLLSNASQVGVPALARASTTFRKLEIDLPSIEIQRKAIDIILELQQKIAVNRRICANLEAQAQALFKHWFIDFAPFKDGKFVESELGMIPEGWRVGTYSDIIKDTISGDWGKDSSAGIYNHKVACIRGCDFQDVKMGLRGKTPERFILEKNFQSKHFENKDVLVEISGGTATVSTGRVCPVSQLLINRYNGDVVCTNFCKLIRPIEGYSSYLYYSWKYKYDRKVMFGYENGTSGIKNFSIKDFTTREPLVLPTLTALNEFEGMIEHIHTQIQNCGSESSKLAVIRDTLLPKLMSGEIKV